MLYFDHNATTPVAPEVAEAMHSAIQEVYGNPSSSHRAGQLARQRLEAARSGVARAAGVLPSELVFTGGGTESNNLAIFGLVVSLPLGKRHVITTAIEHPAVLEPIARLERQDVSVSVIPVGKDCIVDPLEILEHIRPETVLVSVMHANNETGAIQPVAQIAAAIRSRRSAGQPIYFHSDGVQAFGKVAALSSESAPDLYSVSAHKISGPKGVGALALRKGTPLKGIQLGGRHEHERRAGTENVPAVIGFARAVELFEHEYAAGKGMAHTRDRFEEQVLSSLDDVQVNGSTVHRLPNTSNLLFGGVSGETLLIALDSQGFAVSTGSACSSGSIEPSHVLLAMGRSKQEARSSVRFSFGRSNSAEQADRLAEAVVASVRHIRRSKERLPQLALR